jgi:hypothetical protein
MGIHEPWQHHRSTERHIRVALPRRDRDDPPVVERDNSPVERRVRYRQNPVG